ncbi:17608_t:CDS:2, partial [Dentiscutata erythropus]
VQDNALQSVQDDASQSVQDDEYLSKSLFLIDKASQDSLINKLANLANSSLKVLQITE